MVLLFLAATATSQISLDAVYAKVQSLPGVEIVAEMVRPSSIEMRFKVAAGGRMWSKYPTTESYITVSESVTWMPDTRQFSREKPHSTTPVPGGFESLWPGGTRMSSAGESKDATFAGKSAIELPCKSNAGDYPVSLFVDKSTLMPVGTIATANGTTYEIQYKSVVARKILPAEVTFTPPSDARPFKQEPLDAKLIKPGAKLSAFKGKDVEGKPFSSQQALAGKRGLVINFWFSACTGCIQEMPFLRNLEGKLKAQQIMLVGVNPIDAKETAKKTIKLNQLGFSTMTGKEAKTFANAVGVLAYPATIVVDANGTVVDSMMGFSEKRLLEALKKVGYTP